MIMFWILIGVVAVVAMMAIGLWQIDKPLPAPPKGSYAEFLNDQERLSVQSRADYEIALEVARSRGWQG